MSFSLNVQIGRKLNGKTKEDILKQLLNYFPCDVVVAVQIAYEVIPVTFKDSTSYKPGMEKMVDVFSACGVPLWVLVHRLRSCMSSIFLSRNKIPLLRRRFVLMAQLKPLKSKLFWPRTIFILGQGWSLIINSRPPRDLMIKGFLCRTWYRGQPLVCNLCAVEGHRSANCPNKDKCWLSRIRSHLSGSVASAGGSADVVPPAVSDVSAPAGGS